MVKAVLVNASDWEGLYINGSLVEEGHSLNEGHSRPKYFAELASRYKFELKDMVQAFVTCEYEEVLNEVGSFPDDLSEVQYISLKE